MTIKTGEEKTGMPETPAKEQTPGENLTINGNRLWDSLMDMAKIGPGIAGGNNRQTLTDEDAEGRNLFKRWCEAAGMSIGVDTH
ncbi:hypothetical protein ATO67_03815, partial [Agrobacterium bohemicum]